MRTAATTAGSSQSPPPPEGEALREGVVARSRSGRRRPSPPGRWRNRRSGTGRVVACASGGGPAIRASPCYGAAGLGPASAKEAGQQGESAAGPLAAVAEERLVGRGGAALDDVVARHTAGHQLLAVGRHQVDQPVARAVGPGHGGMERSGRRRLRAAPAAPRRRPDSARGAPPARRRRGCARSRPRCACMARSAAPTAPAAVPRQPAWTAARTCASGSTRASGTQSATMMASVTPGRHRDEDVGVGQGVARRSACRGRARRARRASRRAPCTWRAKTRSSSVTPNAAAARARLATTRPGSSPTCRPRLSVSYGGAETPPCRVVTATSAPRPRASAQRTSGGAGDRARVPTLPSASLCAAACGAAATRPGSRPTRWSGPPTGAAGPVGERAPARCSSAKP